MTSQNNDLLPCPFCGGAPHRGPGKVYHDQLHGEPMQDFGIWCPRGHAKITMSSQGLAIKEWNTRASPAPADGVREALAGLIEAVERDTNGQDQKGISGYTSARLSDARRALAGKAQRSGDDAVVDQIIGQIEERFPNWRSYRDLIDCIDCTLHDLRGQQRAADDDEAYELGKRDGYESAIQDLDIATGGDGEFKGSTIPGQTVDVPAMKQRIIDQFKSAHWREVEMWRLIDLLRSQEGDSVTILCDNPEPCTEAENNAVICNGDWTDWEDRRFSGVSLLDALSAAMIEYKRPKEPTSGAQRTDGGVT